MTSQLTIRNIPEPVSLYLRKKAKLTNKSLNQVVIDELSEKVPSLNETADKSLAWFFGIGIDKGTLEAIQTEDILQKQKIAQEYDLSRHKLL